MTDAELLERYKIAADFISRCFGSNVEVVVHDVRKDLNHSAIALYNSHVSGRMPGAPMTRLGKQFLDEKRYLATDYICNYGGVTENGVAVRASTLFIKNAKNRIVGFLCVNVDLTMYNQAMKTMNELVNFDGGNPDGEEEFRPADNELFPRSVADRISRTIADYSHRTGKRADALVPEDKYAIVDQLEKDGLFLIKGVIGDVAVSLRLSEPTIYRYLKRIRKAGRK